MSDTNELDAVLEEFSYLVPPSFLRSFREERMADEIVQLRKRLDRAERILAALRRPSDEVAEAALKEYRRNYCQGPLLILHYAHHTSSLTQAIRAAIAAAKREVDA